MRPTGFVGEEGRGGSEVDGKKESRMGSCALNYRTSLSSHGLASH